jgi:hypothetical protein
MIIKGRKLSSFLPGTLGSWANRFGREQDRLLVAARSWMFTSLLLTGGAIEHLHGPTDVAVGENELLVACLVRNGTAHLPTFMRHYRRLGASHIVLVDNCSTDDTVRMASSYDGVTIYGTALPFSRYETAIKQWLARLGGDGWTLIADVDELFDYPYSRALPLPRFLEYLNGNGYDAVCAQNLEMVPDQPLLSYQGKISENLEESHRFYDLSDIVRTREPYWLRMNQLGSDDLWSHTGGIWRTFFGYMGSKLTKQPLLRARSGLHVFPYDMHFVTHARIADVSGVFRHYKYTGAFVEHVKEELARREHYNGAEIFDHYARVLRENPDLSFVRPTSRKYGAAEELLASGFLVASSEYRCWAYTRGASDVRVADANATVA